MKLKRFVSAAAMIVAVQAPSHATTITLDFGSLPSAQGWTYASNPDYYPDPAPIEASVFSVDGTKLIQNTIGTGISYAGYVRPNPLNPLLPFSISVRARVLQSEEVYPGAPATSFLAYATTGSEFFAFGLNMDTISGPSHLDIYHPIDATIFHTYRLEAVPGVSAVLYVDDVLFGTATPSPDNEPSILGIGNASSFEKGHVEVTMFQVTQVPEPSTSLLLSLGLASVFFWSRTRRGGNRAA